MRKRIHSAIDYLILWLKSCVFNISMPLPERLIEISQNVKSSKYNIRLLNLYQDLE